MTELLGEVGLAVGVPLRQSICRAAIADRGLLAAAMRLQLRAELVDWGCLAPSRGPIGAMRRDGMDSDIASLCGLPAEEPTG